MYDTVILKLPKEDLGANYKWQTVFNSILQTCEYKQVEGGFGYLKGLRVSATIKRVTISGSLSKFYYNGITKALTLAQTKHVISMLSHELRLPIHKATVLRVDIGENFEMEHPVDLYISKMQSLGSAHPNQWKGTVYLPSNGALVCFYDKANESRHRDKRRPKRSGLPMSEGKKLNLLRYEARFTGAKIRQMFGRKLKVSDLYDKQVFWRLVSEWLCTYEEIGKFSDKILDVTFDQIKSQSDMIDWCICIANSTVKIPHFIKEQVFKHRENPQETDRQYHKRLQDRIQKALLHFNEQIGQSELILELTKKIEDYLTQKFENSSDAYDDK